MAVKFVYNLDSNLVRVILLTVFFCVGIRDEWENTSEILFHIQRNAVLLILTRACDRRDEKIAPFFPPDNDRRGERIVFWIRHFIRIFRLF